MSLTDNMQNHHRNLERAYAGAAINHTIPSTIEVSDDITVRMTVRRDFWHSGHAMHGSMYFRVGRRRIFRGPIDGDPNPHFDGKVRSRTAWNGAVRGTHGQRAF